MGFNLDKLAEIAKPRSENAKKMARMRKENREWLRMSQEIALSLHCYLRKMKMTQKDLAERMEVSPTYIGRLLKGQENLTLDTICRLQKVTGQELVSVVRPYEYKEVLTLAHISALAEVVRITFRNDSIEQMRNENGQLVFVPQVLVQFASLNYGSLRGALFLKTQGSPLADYVLPPMFFGQIVDKAFMVE